MCCAQQIKNHTRLVCLFAVANSKAVEASLKLFVLTGSIWILYSGNSILIHPINTLSASGQSVLITIFFILNLLLPMMHTPYQYIIAYTGNGHNCPSILSLFLKENRLLPFKAVPAPCAVQSVTKSLWPAETINISFSALNTSNQLRYIQKILFH